MFYELEVGGKVYKLRLDIKSIIALEKKLGCNPLMIFGSGDTIPKTEDMITILFYALQSYNHGITFEDTYTIFENWLAEGHVVTDFVNELLGIFRVSGIIRSEEKN